MNILTTSSLSVVLAVAIIMSSCATKDAPNQQSSNQASEHQSERQISEVVLSADQYAMAGIELGMVEIKNLSSVIKVNGMLDAPPQNVVSVSPRIGGYIRSTLLLQGLRVRKGQMLAVVEHQDVAMLQQEFLETRSRLQFAEAEFQRQETLQKENINAVKTFQQTATDYKILQARLAALKQRLALIGINGNNLRDNDVRATYTLTSPIDGYVGDVNITLGQFVSPNDVLCRIINTSHIHAELLAFERDAPKLRQGQRVRLTLVNETTERMAKVYLIGREITKERTLRVHAHLDKEDERLLPNTALTALIELGEQAVPAVPEAALVSANGKEYLFALDQEHTHNGQQNASTKNQRNPHVRFQRIEVRSGASAGGFTEVLLPEHFDRAATKIVIKGAYSLLSAMQSDGGGEGHHH
jgi:cobalt-zinc-cadmium efflux system membrane fusion protein